MNTLIIVAIIVFLVVCFKFHRMHKKNVQFTRELGELGEKFDVIQDTNKKLIQKLEEVPTKRTSDLYTKEHTIIINSDKNVLRYDFPYKLKNVKHVELISGIIPKSEYRLNQYNNVINSLSIQPGSYSDVIAMLMYVNQVLYDNSTGIILLFDSVARKIIAVAPATTIMDISDENTIAPSIGFEPGIYTFPSGTTYDANVITTSLSYFTLLQSSSATAGRGINNLPPAYYTFTSQFPSNAINPVWEYLYGTDRVNMKHQLYVDVSLDEVTYWDATHRLARIYIPEDKEETEYQSYGRPILRSLNQEYIDLDKLTFRLNSVVSESNTHEYDLNGLNYSLQVQITTVDKLLLTG